MRLFNSNPDQGIMDGDSNPNQGITDGDSNPYESSFLQVDSNPDEGSFLQVDSNPDEVIDVESNVENIQCNAREKTPPIVSLEESYVGDLYGKIVKNEQEAYDLYNEYAAHIGFSIRKKQRRYDKNGDLSTLNFCCSKEGFRQDRDPCEEKKTKRLDERTGCQAKIRFLLEDGEWKVSTFDPEHNHELAMPEERQFLRSNRKISEAHMGVIKTMANAGIRTTNTYSYLAEEVGGSQNVGFTKTDCYNFVSKEKRIILKAGDAQSLINHFKRKQAEDPMFFYTVQVDQENRMTNFFWRDGKSRIDYECFGDVVVFDTTYRTNKYNMICAPFVGVNHHWSNVLLGCAFLLDEKTATFEWLFEAFLESMGNRKPTTIFTDQCQAMANAIMVVFPGTCHRLCTWHISMNATRNIPTLYGIPEFKRLFNKCLDGCQTELEFQHTWDTMIEEFNVAQNKWLKGLYAIREKWCPVFSQDAFSVRIKSTQRSESMNNVFHRMSTKTMTLTEFVLHYEKQANGMRSKELEETFRCKQGLPSTVAKNSGFLKRAASVYTRKIYKFLEYEFVGSLAVKMREVESDGTLQTFELNEEGHRTVYVVKFNSSTFNISCSCKRFESMGLLCRHTLRVMNVKEVSQIPNQYILKRWTKDAKKEWNENEHGESLHVSDNSSVTLRRNTLMRIAYGILSMGAETESCHRIAMKKLKEMAQLLDKEMKSNGEEIANKENNDILNDATVRDTDGVNNSSDEAPVLNPPSVRPKGISNARLKSHIEKRKKKTSNVPGSSKKTKPPSSGGPSHTANANARSPSTNQFYPTMTMPTANSHACFPSPNQLYPTLSLLTTNTHARFPSSNQFYPTTRLSTTNVQTSLPLSNQSPNYSWSCSPPNFTFTNVLQSQNYMTHLNQDAFPCGFEEHEDACNS